jgi:two-component system response regulator DevR
MVDDHPVVRAGLRTLLEAYREFNIVGEAATSSAAITEALRLKPDIILMDIRLPDGCGIEACRRIRKACLATRLLFLTSYHDEEIVFGTIAAGADGFVLKDVDEAALIQAIRAVASGKSFLDPAVTRSILARLRSAPHPTEHDPVEAVTAREEQVLKLMLEGRTNKEIATALSLSDKTVRNYLTVIFDKLHVSRRTQAIARYALLFSPGDKGPNTSGQLS